MALARAWSSLSPAARRYVMRCGSGEFARNGLTEMQKPDRQGGYLILRETKCTVS